MRPLVAVLATALLLAACGSSSSGSATSSPTSSTQATSGSDVPPVTGGPRVVMKGLAFAPATIHAKPGQTVNFVNEDTPPHNVVPDGGAAFTASPTLNPGASFHLKLSKPGTYHYLCTIHPFMKGTIVVGS